ncbi:hypothetical protein [Burkholderia sp. Z1]|nr:hypothetical protein [Burkholderia sp. Z1]
MNRGISDGEYAGLSMPIPNIDRETARHSRQLEKALNQRRGAADII